MRLNDIILENQNLEELNLNAASAKAGNAVPQNTLSQVKTKLQQYNPLSANTRAKAKGLSQIGKDANALMKSYQTYLGTLGGEQPTLGNITDWLHQQQLPVTGKVATLINKIKTDSQAAAQQTPAPQTPTTPSAPAKPAVDTTHPADNEPNVHLSTNEDAEAESEIVLNNNMVGEIISAAVAERNRTAPGTGATSSGTASGSSSGSSTAQPAPITAGAVLNFYKSLDANGRQQLKTQMDKIDKAPVAEAVKLDDSEVGFSRFLGMQL